MVEAAALIGSSVVIIGVIVGAALRNTRSIGRLEGKVDGINDRLDVSNGRIGRLEDRMDKK